MAKISGVIFGGGKTKKMEKRRMATREEHWPQEIPWLSQAEVGYFSAPRTLPLILGLLSQKRLRGSHDLTTTYLELFSRHHGQGVVQMDSYDDHAYRAGYSTKTGVATWQKRRALLEELGFIRAVPSGNRRFGIVLLVHPTIAVGRLRERDRSLVEESWWNFYREEQRRFGEPAFEELIKARTVKVPDPQAAVSVPVAVPSA
ncbi:MAG: hypothetical protein ACJ8CN_09125 [Gemmatimonadales bacterium]